MPVIKKKDVQKLVKLPDVALEIMRLVWATEGEITAPKLLASGETKGRAHQTVITLLDGLEKRGFLKSTKRGCERIFTPLVTEEEYTRFETNLFVEAFHKNSIVGLVNAFYANKKLEQNDIEALRHLLDERATQE